jgi:hypothetical protein
VGESAEDLHPELALARLGLRFASRDTEARYRAWHARQAMPFLRVAYTATIVFVFPAALLATWFAVPDAFGDVARWVLLMLAPLGLGIACTYREWMLRWMGPTTIAISSPATS